MRILLQGFSFIEKNGNYNIGILLLQSSLLARPSLADQVDVKVIQSDYFDELEDIEREIREYDPDLVGLSIHIWSLGLAAELSKRCSDLPRRPILVCGGRGLIAGERQFMARNPAVDVATSGEGEQVFVSLIEHFLAEPKKQRCLAHIPGIIFRDDDDELISTAPATSRVVMAEIPSPYRSGHYRPRHSFSIESERNCPFRCRYCTWSSYHGDRTNSFPLDYVAEEVRWAVDNGLRDIRFWESAVNCSTDRFVGLLDLFDEVAAGLDFCLFYYLVKYELMNRRQLDRLLASSANAVIALSIESFSEEALRIVNRPAKLERFKDILSAVDAAKSGRGSQIVTQLVMGLPGDDLATLFSALEYFRQFPEVYLCVNPLILLPGSDFAARSEEYEFVCSNEGLPFVKSSSAFSEDDMERGIERVQELNAAGHSFEFNSIWAPVRRIKNPHRIRADLLRGRGQDAYIRVGVLGIDDGYVEISGAYPDW